MFELNNYPIGLDISETSIKLIQLKKSGGFKLGKKKGIENLEVNCYNKIKIPSGLIINGEIKQADEIAKQIEKLIETTKGGKITNKEVVISLPPSQTFSKLITIPNIKEEDKIEENVKNEIIKHIPISLKDVYTDWQLINRQSESMDMMVGTAPQQIVDQYTNLLEKVGLQPTAIETEAAAISRSLIIDAKIKDKKDNGPFLILDFGGHKSNIVICSEDAIFLTIGNPISSDNMTEKIASTLSISTEQAEKVKKVCGLDQKECKGAVRELLDEMVNKLIDDINKAISFFQNTYTDIQIKKIMLSGSGSNIIGIETMLSQQLQIPTEKGNPWRKITQNDNSKYKELNDDTLSYITAIGLSLRGTIEKD